MFPVAGVRCDPVQWWAPKDCRPLGKPQVCGRQSPRNCALWQLWIKTLSGHLNHWGNPPPSTQPISPCSLLKCRAGSVAERGGRGSVTRCLPLPPALLGIFQGFVTVEPGCSPLSWSHGCCRHLSWSMSQQLRPTSPLGLGTLLTLPGSSLGRGVSSLVTSACLCPQRSQRKALEWSSLHLKSS